MRVGLDSVVFAYDFDRLTTDGLLYDYGPHGLHATPGAGAAAPTRQLDGSYYFDGGDYFSLSGASQTRFYANAPTGAYTVLLVSAVSQPAIAYAFSSFSQVGANFFGMLVGQTPTAALQGTIHYNLTGTAALPSLSSTAAAPVLGILRLRSICYTVEATPRLLYDGQTVPVAWAAGAFAAIAHDVTVAPRIGMTSGGLSPMLGRLYYLCLLRGAVSSADMAELSAMMCNGFKPFCWR